MKKITADMTVAEVLQINPETAEIFKSVGMHCFGCAMARGETVEQAAMVHNQDIQELVEKLNNVTE